MLSPSGHAASPEDIIASCQALQAHIQKVQQDAERTIKDWENELREEELAEKRRVAPGWLDRDEKILQPNRTSVIAEPTPGAGGTNLMDQQDDQPDDKQVEAVSNPAGDELDRAFGGLGLRKE